VEVDDHPGGGSDPGSPTGQGRSAPPAPGDQPRSGILVTQKPNNPCEFKQEKSHRGSRPTWNVPDAAGPRRPSDAVARPLSHLRKSTVHRKPPRRPAGDHCYAEETHPGDSMRSSPEKRGRISRWWDGVQRRRLLKRNRASASGEDRLGHSRRHRRVTVEDLYPNAEKENEE
jgi:hypothetical protein